MLNPSWKACPFGGCFSSSEFGEFLPGGGDGDFPFTGFAVTLALGFGDPPNLPDLLFIDGDEEFILFPRRRFTAGDFPASAKKAITTMFLTICAENQKHNDI